jgi:hypothetical protein
VRDVEKDAEAGSKRSPKKRPKEILRDCLGIDSEKILRVGYPADLRVVSTTVQWIPAAPPGLNSNSGLNGT